MSAISKEMERKLAERKYGLQKTDDVKSECGTDKRGRLPPSEWPGPSSLGGDTTHAPSANYRRHEPTCRRFTDDTSFAKQKQQEVSRDYSRRKSRVMSNGCRRR